MIIEIKDIKDPALDIFCNLTESQLRNAVDSEGLFIAESPKVINVAIDHGYEPLSLLCERKHINGDARRIIERFPEMPVYTADRDILRNITGYTLTRGVLCAMRRKPLASLKELCGNSTLLCVMQGICDTTNVGAIFRSASALGVDGIILSADTCDPLNRRAVRVSMGTVFTIPWTIIENPVEELKGLGFATAALALCEDSISLDNDKLKQEKRLAVVFGTEGEGLPRSVIEQCDYTVRIPMMHGVDSLNVAAAAAVTFWELRR